MKGWMDAAAVILLAGTHRTHLPIINKGYDCITIIVISLDMKYYFMKGRFCLVSL